MEKQRKIICCILLLFSLVIYSQESEEDDELYNEIKVEYLKKVESGDVSAKLFNELANLYYFAEDYVNAEIWYKKLYELEDRNKKPNYLFRYSKSLKEIGNEEYSKAIYDEFLIKNESENNKN